MRSNVGKVNVASQGDGHGVVRIDYKPAINVGSITFDQPWTGLTPDFPKGRLGFYKGGPPSFFRVWVYMYAGACSLFTVHCSLFTFSKGQRACVLAPGPDLLRTCQEVGSVNTPPPICTDNGYIWVWLKTRPTPVPSLATSECM